MKRKTRWLRNYRRKLQQALYKPWEYIYPFKSLSVELPAQTERNASLGSTASVQTRRTFCLGSSSVVFVAAAVLVPTIVPYDAQAWIGFPHGISSTAPPPLTPVWPSPGPGTNYYISDITGNDANNGLSTATSWKTPAKVISFSFSGTVTINWDGNSTFTMPNAGSFSPIASSTWQSVFGTQATILANNTGGAVFNIATAGVSLLSLKITGDNVAPSTIKSVYGVNVNNVPFTTISGCIIQNFYGDGAGVVGAEIICQGDVHGTRIGGVISSDARNGGIADNVIGGMNGPTSRDENGILFNFCPISSGFTFPVRIKGNLVQNCGALANPSGGSNGQVGFGSHLTVLPSSFTPTAFTWGSDGEPTNYNCELAGNVTRNIGGAINTCGGASGHEWGSSFNFWEHDCEYSYIGPTGTFNGHILGTTLTIDGNALGYSIADLIGYGYSPWVYCGGISYGTQVTGGSGSVWTINNSQTIGSSVSPVKITVINRNGACDQDGTDVDGGCQIGLVERIYCHDIYGPGILQFCAGNIDIIARYNLSVNCGYANDNEGAFAITAHGGTGSIYCYNNTTIAPDGIDTNTSYPNLGLESVGNLSGFAVNNIFCNATLVQSNDASYTFLLSHNNYGGVGSVGTQAYAQGGNNYSSLSAWAAADNGSDQNGFAFDPLFIFTSGYNTSTTNSWRLSASSPLLNVGVDVTTLSPPMVKAVDFYGTLPVNQHNNVGCYLGAGV